MKTLVIGGTGQVGSHVVAGLIAKGSAVRVLSRSKERNKNLPESVEVAVGDLNDPSSVMPAFEGVDAIFFLNPVAQSETNEGIVAASMARSSKATRLVYMSVQNLTGAPHLPHFGGKIGVEAAVKASKIPYTILQPNNFFQNDVWFKDAMMSHGVYPQPIGQKGLHRVDARDIADAAVNALTKSGFENKTYVLAGPQAMNGNSTAEIYSAKLGKKVAYGGDDLEAWAKVAGSMMPAWMLYDLKMMYAEFQQNGLLATPSELAECEKIVGHPLRTFDAFAEEMAKSWK